MDVAMARIVANTLSTRSVHEHYCVFLALVESANRFVKPTFVSGPP
jgi:hypothetical protein